MIVEEFLKASKIKFSFKVTGQKKVYLVDHNDHGEVIVKFGKSSDSNSLERAKREVDALKEIQSQFFPRNIDFKFDESSNYLIVEEYIPSKPLAENFEVFNTEKKVKKLLFQLFSGMEILWEKKITHRDLKPDNILIREDLSPVIIDLGILLIKDLTQITHPFAHIGPCTPNYAAPEQLKNRRAAIDHRTDQFILGIVMAQLLNNGNHIFDPQVVKNGRSTPENIIANNRVDSFPKLVSQEFLDFINKLIEPEPYMRFKEFKTLKQRLDL